MSAILPVVSPMTPDDLDEIMLLERQCFTDPWTRRMYLSDLTTNEMATYLVVRRGDAATKGRGDAGTRGRGDAGTRGRGDAGTRGRGDAGTRGRGDAATKGRGDAETRGRGDAGTRGRGDAGMRGNAQSTENGVAASPLLRVPVSPLLRVPVSPLLRVPVSPLLRVPVSPLLCVPVSPLLAYGGLWLMLDEAHIATIASHPDWRGCGLGEWLMLALLDAAIQRGAVRSTLEVRANNLPAQRLYEKLGYEVVGRRKHYYRDGEDGLIMTTPPLADPALQERLALAREDALRRITRCLKPNA